MKPSKLQEAIDKVRAAKNSKERVEAIDALVKVLEAERHAEDATSDQVGLDAAAKADLYRQATALIADTGPGDSRSE